MSHEPKMLFIDDDYMVLGYYEAEMRRYFPTTIMLTASTLDEASTLIDQHAAELALIIFDGCVPGDELNTIPLIHRTNALNQEGIFRGLTVAVSSSIVYCNEMVREGCSYSSNKFDIVRELHETLVS